MTNEQKQSSLVGDEGTDQDPPQDDPPAEDPPTGGGGGGGGDGGDPAGGEAPGDGEDVDELAFEQALEELETIVQELEDGKLGLEEAMDRFERGLVLVKACRGKLKQAELKVEELLEDGSTQELES